MLFDDPPALCCTDDHLCPACALDADGLESLQLPDDVLQLVVGRVHLLVDVRAGDEAARIQPSYAAYSVPAWQPTASALVSAPETRRSGVKPLPIALSP